MKSLSHCLVYGVATSERVGRRKLNRCDDAGECKFRMDFDGKKYCTDRLLKEKPMADKEVRPHEK